FISIDCGLSENGYYTDETTTLNYISDEGFTEAGTNMDISSAYRSGSLAKQLTNVRSFPQGIKNCYTLRPENSKGNNYLIRTTFMYGNYDSLNKPPQFDLHLGTDVWDTVKLDNSSHVVVKEMIYTPTDDYLYVCLANTGLGTPFISVLELRHLNSSTYKRVSGSLELVLRYYTSTTSLENIRQIMWFRYKDDIYDRVWEPAYLQNQNTTSTTAPVDGSIVYFRLPSAAMQAAMTPKNSNDPMLITLSTESSTTQYYMFLHFAELQKLSANETREFNITVNGVLFYGPYSPAYLISNTLYTPKPVTGSKLSFQFEKTARSTLPPILNAMEYFKVKDLSQALTSQQDVDSISKIKSAYTLSKNWQGDPCVPQSYMWDGVNCSFTNPSSPAIIVLNLSSSGLTGSIADSFSNLTSLQILDLSNNSLTGDISESLTGLTSLTVLNLADNKLTGSVPQYLLDKSANGQLDLSTGGNPDLCASSSCAKKKKSIIIPVVASVGALLCLAASLGVVFLIMKRKPGEQQVKQQQSFSAKPAYTKNKGGLSRFSYSEVTNMTGDFQRQLGKGGFGSVYYGCLKDGTEVAVKKLYSAAHSLEQFETEVELLMAIRHKNLVSLIGYCDEGENLVLIYEYMAFGDLQHILKECLQTTAEQTPTWKQRLQIAIDAAQGLDYLHNGCRPPIVHRDVKTPNILLNENFQAKVADFGLSKIFPDEHRSYVSTRVIGTPGYLDPGYYSTQQLNEKSDVYSFGVVVLELMTGQPAIIRSEATNVPLADKVAALLETGDIWSIIDPRLKDSIHNQNSIWRAVDVAMACVKMSSVERPAMNHIVTELKESLAMEMDARSQGNYNSSTSTFDSVEISPSVPITGMAPRAR
ncbi:hypothetical protein V2J09_011161, partial [Rumex salicifolius]